MEEFENYEIENFEKDDKFKLIKNQLLNKNENFMRRHFYGSITSLHILENKYLLAGNGNILKIYKIDEGLNLIFTKQIFENNKVTKIKSFNILGRDGDKILIILIGENEIKFSLIDGINNFEEKINTNFIEFKSFKNKNKNNNTDYIVAVNLIEVEKSSKTEAKINPNDQKNNDKIILTLGYMGNYIDLITLSLSSTEVNLITRIFCPEKCIVYSMNTIIDKKNVNLIISSGTVFRNIIIWVVSLSNYKIISCFNLLGHEGVIFNLFFADMNNLVSVSDDRTTRHWIINYEAKTYSVDSYIGHSARVWDAKIIFPKNILVSVGEDCNVRLYDLKSKSFIKELTGAHVGKNVRCVELNDDFIFTAGEDWQIIKWNLNSLLGSDECKISDNLFNDNDSNFFNYVSENDDQVKLARIKQKLFTPSVKFIKFCNQNFVLIGTNHGQVIKYNIENKNVEEIIFADEQLRVINSIEVITIKQINTYVIIIGLSDGSIAIIIQKNNLAENKFPKFIQIFNNIRVSFISHKFTDDDLILIFSNPIGVTKIIFTPKNKIVEKISEKFNFKKCLLLNSGAKIPLPISSSEIIKINKSEFLIFLGDSDGHLYFTLLKLIDEKFYNFSDFKFLKIHTGKITQIENYNNMNYFYSNKTNKNNFVILTSARDGKLKTFLIYNKFNKNINSEYFTIKEIDFKFRNDVSSLEKFFHKNDELLLIGHHGRNLVMYDNGRNSLFHSNDVSGNNRPFDIIIEKEFITYCYSEAKNYYVVKIPNSAIIKRENQFCDLLNTPLHGRLIHSVKLLNLAENCNFKILITGSEDSNINFYLVDINNLDKLIYLEKFSKHSGAIRHIELVETNIKTVKYSEENNLFLIYEFYLVSVAACSECFLFKFQIALLQNTNNGEISIKNNNLYFLSDLSVKQQNLDTRNMAVTTYKLNKRLYLISYCNTISKTENFIFDLNQNEFDFMNNKQIELKNTNFIPLTLAIINPNPKNNSQKFSENNSENEEYFILHGLTNGVLYITKIKINNSDLSISKTENMQNNTNNTINQYQYQNQSQYKIHQAGINEIKYDEKSNLIFTCSEDNSITISNCSFRNNNYISDSSITNKYIPSISISIEILRKIKSLHSSPIKSINFINLNDYLFLVTGGYDQKINILKIRLDTNFHNEDNSSKCNNTILEMSVLEIKTCLAELNKVDLLQISSSSSENINSDSLIICCSGQGLESFVLNKNKI